MTELLFIRHGETAWNAERRLQGHLDIPLNAEGERQAAALGQALAGETLDAVISSDLRRAVETARAVAAPRAMPVLIDKGLRERCFGAFEGLLYDEIALRFPHDHASWKARDPDARYPQGVHVAETLNEFFARVRGTIDRLVRHGSYRKIALVTHGGVLDCVYRIAGALDVAQPRNFDVLNASVNRVRWTESGMQVVQWADVSHLERKVLDEIDR
jgi:probable phosphoglycerate mutase